MKFLHILSGILLLLIIIAIGGGTAYTAWLGLQPWMQALDLLKHFRMTAWFGGLGMLMLMFFYLVTFIRRKKKDASLSFKTEDGVVNINVEAVRNFIDKVGDEFADIVSMRTELTTRRGAPDIALNLRVKAGAQIPELCRMMQSRIRDTLQAQVGIHKIHRMEINVKEITGAIPPMGMDPDDRDALRAAGIE